MEELYETESNRGESTPELADWMTGQLNGMANARYYDQHELGTDEDDGNL